MKKVTKVSRIFVSLSMIALIGIFFSILAVGGKSGFESIGDIFGYVYNFIFIRSWDVKKIIGFVVGGVSLVLWVIWFTYCAKNKEKTDGEVSILEPIITLMTPFLLLAIYHYRARISTVLNAEDTKIAGIIMLALLCVFVVTNIFSIIFALKKDVTIVKEYDEWLATLDDEESEEHECCCCEEHSESEDECECTNSMEDLLVETKNTLVEIRELLKVFNDREAQRTAFIDELVKVKDNNVDDKEEDEETDEDTDSSNETVVEKRVIIRRPFAEKMAVTTDENKENYDIIKNELLSYGVKSRLSHGGDTFRLKREEYAMITLVGKNLKLYLALNPDNYVGSTIPTKDESGKKRFKEVPTMLRIKSKLSVKRAKILIADLMSAKELPQGEVQEVKYSDEFKVVKPKKAKK